MSILKIIGIFLTLAFSAGCIAQFEAINKKTELAELRMAEWAITRALVAAVSDRENTSCRVEESVTSSVPPQDLALALIAARETAASRELLARLVAYRFDGNLAESYSCYVLSKAPSILKSMKSIGAKSYASKCQEQVKMFVSRNAPVYADVDIDLICKTSSEIESELSEYERVAVVQANCQ